MTALELANELNWLAHRLDSVRRHQATTEGLRTTSILREAADMIRTSLDEKPNDPLTLEELREMDGEPVWVVWVPQLRKKFPPFWGIVSTEYEDVECTLYCVMFEDYGGEWIAYRRKLEDE